MRIFDILPLIIIAITVITSIRAFSNQQLFDRLKFNTSAILQRKQWDRLLSSALIHGDYMHLLFNMLTLYFFSDLIIAYLGNLGYIIIYIASILCGGLLSLWMHRKNPYYSAIGASGGITGILFAAVALEPNLGIYIMFIPIAIPGYIFGIVYLAFSIYAMKKQLGNIGHDAHLGGAVAGLLLAVIFMPGLLVHNILYIGIMSIPIAVLAYFVYKERK